MGVLCPSCETFCLSLTSHFNEHPLCEPVDSDDEEPPDLVSTESDDDYDDLSLGLERARQTLEEMKLQEQVASDLAALRFEHGLKETAISAVKEAVRKWIPLAQSVEQACAPSQADATGQEQPKPVDVFAGLATATQELGHMQCDVASLTARTTELPEGKVVSHDLGEMITRHLVHDTAYRKQCEAKSDEWKKGDRYRTLPKGQLKDFDDGINARFHPHLLRPATPDEEHDLRIAVNVQVDDLEVRAHISPSTLAPARPTTDLTPFYTTLPSALQLCNAIGVARGEHKECGVQVATLNLPAEERFQQSNIFLHTLAKAKIYKVHGMARVLNGRDKSNVLHDDPCLARDLRELAPGRWIEIPDDKKGGTKMVCLRVYLMIISADWLARQSLLPFVESPGAHCPCGDCDYDVRSDMAGRPFSFLRDNKNAPWNVSGSGKRQKAIPVKFTKRTWSQLKAEVETFSKLSPTQQTKMTSETGVNKSIFALNPTDFPFIDPTAIAPRDLLHLFPDGLLRSECAWCIYILCGLGLKLSDVNRRIAQYKRFLPKDVRIPFLHHSLAQGEAGNRPKPGATIRMTGHQMKHFAVHR